MPRCEEYCAADVQPDPFPVISQCRVDSRAVPDAVSSCPARSGRGRILASLAIFIIIVVVVIIVIIIFPPSLRTYYIKLCL